MKTKKNYFVSCKILLILLLLVILVFFICFYYVNLKKAEKNQNIVTMNNVRQKFLLARETTNNTYYVSQNGTSTEGTDINNPMSFAVAKTKSYHANDKILFKCGDTFYDRIIFKTDLSEGENIYIGSYGDGEKPIISGAKILEKIVAGKGEMKDLDLLEELALSVKEGSLCGLGKTAPNPVLSTLKYFRDEYIAHIKDKKCPAGVCTAMKKIVIQPELCKGCTKCARTCPVGAIEGTVKQPHHINQEKCIKCEACLTNCPFKAIVLE